MTELRLFQVSHDHDRVRNRELKQETSLSKRTSNSRWKTGSTPACVAWLNCLKHVTQCYITATLLVLILFSLFLQISWIITVSKRQEICFSNNTFKDCSHLTAYCFVGRKHGQKSRIWQLSFRGSVYTNALSHWRGFMRSKPLQNLYGLEGFTRNRFRQKIKVVMVYALSAKFTILKRTMQIPRQKAAVLKSMRFRCLHDR